MSNREASAIVLHGMFRIGGLYISSIRMERSARSSFASGFAARFVAIRGVR
jgi:hypothetical protein